MTGERVAMEERMTTDERAGLRRENGTEKGRAGGYEAKCGVMQTEGGHKRGQKAGRW